MDRCVTVDKHDPINIVGIVVNIYNITLSGRAVSQLVRTSDILLKGSKAMSIQDYSFDSARHDDDWVEWPG